jgi:hypothetical protein
MQRPPNAGQAFGDNGLTALSLRRSAPVFVWFIRVHEKETDGGVSEHALYLELDRSSQTQDMLAERATSYLEYYRSGGFAIENGGRRAQYKEYPFRSLFIFRNAERRNNMAERLLRNSLPILTLVYLSTFDEVKANPLGPIWIPE